jgi:tripartite-type tricarboxylate transporter receptor subunit TctC
MRPALKYLAALAIAAMAAGGPVAAQTDYPTRNIRILVPIPPGGAPDIAARLLGNALTESLGQPVVIENRSGANGNLAMDAAAKAPPDGYTLLLGADSNMVINPHVYSKLPFDSMKDLVPVASVASNQFVLAVNPSVPAKTLPEFIEHARKQNPPLAYASGGNGSQHQLAMEMLKQRSGINLLHVPYRGGSPAATATVAGETQVTFAGASSAGLIDGGQMRGLAASGKHRSRRFPDLPTIGEIYPGYEVEIWLGLFAPAGTPEPIVTKLRTEVHALLRKPEFAGKLNVSGSLEPLILSPAEFSDLMKRDYEKYGALVKGLGIKLD